MSKAELKIVTDVIRNHIRHWDSTKSESLIGQEVPFLKLLFRQSFHDFAGYKKPNALQFQHKV